VLFRSLTVPGFDAKRADVAGFVAFAIAEAKREVPDAQLVRIDVDGVYPDGHADLTLPSFAYKYGSIDVRFFSPSHTKGDPKLPRGATQELKCMFRVIGDPDSIEIRDLSSDCKELVVHPPKCSPSAIWKKMLAKRPDLGTNAIASLGYRANIVSKAIQWFFDIRSENVSQTFSDDC